ncbi:MAG: S41 family peptidase [Phycisphaerales bacterium]
MTRFCFMLALVGVVQLLASCGTQPRTAATQSHRAISITTDSAATASAIQSPAPLITTPVPAAQRLVTHDDVRADLEELILAFKDLHPKPFWSKSEARIRAQADVIVERAAGGTLTEREYFRQAAQLVIAFDDPHSWLMTPGYADYRDAGGLLLPIDLRIDGTAATVRFAPPDAQIPAGARLVSVNGEPIEEIVAEFRPLTGQLDDPFGDEFLATFFRRYLWYFRGWSDSFTITYEHQQQLREAQVAGLSNAGFTKLSEAADLADPLVYRALGNSKAVIEFRLCVDPETTRAFCERIFEQVLADGITTLVIDARDNTGGGDASWITLLEFLTEKPFSGYLSSQFRVSQRLKDQLGQKEVEMGYGPDAWAAPVGSVIVRPRGLEDLITPPANATRFNGRWAVMAGRRTFSSGMSFVCAVKAFKLAPIIGSETGGRVKGFGQWVPVKLPRSGMTAAISTKQFDGAVDVPYRRGVPPDIAVAEAPEVVPNSDADPVLAAAMKALADDEWTREARLADFDVLVTKLEANYAGWETKVTPETRAAFDEVVATQRQLAGDAVSDESFLDSARGLIAFFADKHLSIRAARPNQSPGTPAAPATPKLDWTEASVKSKLDADAAKREPLEGIWETVDGRYRLGVLKIGSGAFAASVLASQADNWTPGMIKAEFQPGKDPAITGTWRMGDHSQTAVVGEFLSDGLLVINAAGGTWLQRVYPPAPALDVSVAARNVAWPEVFYLRLSDRTGWLRLPSFQDPVLPKLTAIMEEQKADFATLENLIIDIRNNGGGSDYVYAPIMPLIYSRPVYTVGIQLKCSPDNIAGWEALLTDPQIPADQLESIRNRIEGMRQHLGGYYTPQPSATVETFPEVKLFPKRVALLIEGAGSSGEQFILEAMQSRKVTMFGQGSSAGVLDHANVRSFPLPSGRFEVRNPTSRSLRLPNFPVDPQGIAPDITVPEGEKDEIEFVRKWLEQ